MPPAASFFSFAAALGLDVSVSAEAGEGGPFGAAILASYAMRRSDGESLEEYVSKKVFAKTPVITETPDAALASAYRAYMERWVRGLAVEHAAAENL